MPFGHKVFFPAVSLSPPKQPLLWMELITYWFVECGSR